ncbi:hypothetical protein K8S19_12765 [bacterium]|nr:hypothetical protein [bacterium]
MKKRMIALAVGLVVLSASIGLAKLDPEEQTKVDALVETLALNADQAAKLTQEREIGKQALLKLEKKWQKLHDQLRREVRKRKADKKEVDWITQEIGKVRGEIVALRTHSLIFLKSILDDEQLEKIEQDRPDDESAGQD